jgi:hypothetical protein
MAIRNTRQTAIPADGDLRLTRFQCAAAGTSIPLIVGAAMQAALLIHGGVIDHAALKFTLTAAVISPPVAVFFWRGQATILALSGFKRGSRGEFTPWSQVASLNLVGIPGMRRARITVKSGATITLVTPWEFCDRSFKQKIKAIQSLMEE